MTQTITIHYLNGTSYTLKGANYSWGTFHSPSGVPYVSVNSSIKLVHKEKASNVLAIEGVNIDGEHFIVPFKSCCVVKTSICTKKEWDRGF